MNDRCGHSQLREVSKSASGHFPSTLEEGFTTPLRFSCFLGSFLIAASLSSQLAQTSLLFFSFPQLVWLSSIPPLPNNAVLKLARF